MNDYLLEMRQISKYFPGVQALDHVDLTIKKGQIHALMGENGAGKSTLMKCLFGIYKKDDGEILFEGQPVQIKDTQDALRLGISMVHQELQLIHEQSVAENIFCGRYPLKKIGPFSLIDHQQMNVTTSALLHDIQLNIMPQTKISSCSVSTQQLIEIAKAISNHSKLIIMDEPTSSLTESEVAHLFQIIEQLKQQGTSIIYISHKMEEILTLADQVTIMRDGCVVGSWPKEECSYDMMIRHMVGRSLTQRFPLLDVVPQEVILDVQELSSIHPQSYQNIAFQLRKGEILGIGGLVGAKRSEMVEGLFGLRPNKTASIFYQGQPLLLTSPQKAIKKGLALVTEDRRYSGIFGVLGVVDNICVASLDRYRKKGILSQKSCVQQALTMIQKLQIKTPTVQTTIQSLSGGNQQKVILARWLANDPDLLILDEPTRGIDVGAKAEIYAIMVDLIRMGKSILMISSEMSELLGMSHRILVMCEGKVSGIVESRTTTQEELLRLSTCGKDEVHA